MPNLTQKTLLEVKKTPGIWGRSLEFISGQSRRELLGIKLRSDRQAVQYNSQKK